MVKVRLGESTRLRIAKTTTPQNMTPYVEVGNRGARSTQQGNWGLAHLSATKTGVGEAEARILCGKGLIKRRK